MSGSWPCSSSQGTQRISRDHYFLLQLRISPTAPHRREGSISNDSLVILAAYLCVQKAIIAGMHSLFVQLRFEGLASPPPHCCSWIAETTPWHNHQMGTHWERKNGPIFIGAHRNPGKYLRTHRLCAYGHYTRKSHIPQHNQKGTKGGKPLPDCEKCSC